MAYFLFAFTLLLLIASVVAVYKWKKKHYGKGLYLRVLNAIVPYILATLCTIYYDIMWFCKARDNPESTIVLWFVLAIELVLLYVYIDSSTSCIYLEDGILYKRNLFWCRSLQIDKETEIGGKSLIIWVIKNRNQEITIPIKKYDDGNVSVRKLMHIITEIRDEQKEESQTRKS